MFKKGVRAYRHISGSSEDLYPCPICGLLLPEEAVSTGDLTEEHAPPQSMGGQPIALVCRECNSFAGQRVDASVAHLQRYRDLVGALFRKQGAYNGPVRLHLEDGATLNAELRVGGTEKHLIVFIDRTRNDPIRLDQEISRLEQTLATSGSMTMSMKSKTFDLWMTQVGLLKTAYMVGFAALGYRFLMQEQMAQVREQIQQPDQHVVEGAVTLSDRPLHDKSTVWIMREPVVALAVSFGISTVFLPLPESPANLYQQLSKHLKAEGGVFNFTGSPIPWPSRMPLFFDLPRSGGGKHA
jgi:hypothetical protein